jgi:hypothetical protein
MSTWRSPKCGGLFSLDEGCGSRGIVPGRALVGFGAFARFCGVVGLVEVFVVIGTITLCSGASG